MLCTRGKNAVYDSDDDDDDGDDSITCGTTFGLLFNTQGSIAVAGAAITWLRDNLSIIESATDVDRLAGQVEDSAGVYFVTALTGLLAPYWQDEARGMIVGLSQYADKRHLVRATLEAVAFQTREVWDWLEFCVNQS
jgi:glycerol kinase